MNKGICEMSKYEYRVDAPVGGYTRGIKYRNPYYFDGNPEKDAKQVAVIHGFDSIVKAYESVGITASIISDGGAEQDDTKGGDGNGHDIDGSPLVADSEGSDSASGAAPEQVDTPTNEMTDEQLSALYESKYGRKPGNMKRDTILAALEDE